ncbi:MAG: L-fucose:H+ symporter permease [Gemmatimonadaceae bacterium]|nr:L-fucose:H+ symporter permease [Gemmatimonadaceae bacterium]
MPDRSAPLTERRYVVPFVLVTSLFFLWAIGVNLNDVLIPHLKKALDLSDFQSSLIQTAFFGGYFLMALPAGWIMRRVGYRKGILVGLGLCALGTLLFQPAATARWYPFFLLALFVMACGQCVLEVAANPYVTVLGPSGSAARRLNTAQMFNALGAVITPILGAQFILSGVEHSGADLATMTPAAIEAWRATEATGVKGPYLVITALFVLVGVMIALSKLPEVKEPGEGSGRGLASAWRHAHLRRGVFAQFCYVGAQVGVASFVIRFAQQALPGTGERVAADFLKWHLAGFLAGRVIGTALMTRIPAPRMLAAVAALGVAAAAFAASGSGAAAVWMIVLLGLFHSIQFPTIFALAIDGIGEDTKLGSSLLVMSIVGGAIIPAAMGAISDAQGIQTAFWIPVFCYVVVLHFALRGHKHTLAVTS